MSRAAHRRQSHGLHIFLTVILVILTACVVVKAFFLKAPEQKAAELPASQPAEEENSPSDEEQAAQEAAQKAAEEAAREAARQAAHRRLVIRLTCVGAFSALVIALAVVLIRKLHKAGRC